MMESLLKTRVYKDSGSIKIMDEFESRDENYNKKYDTLELTDLFCIQYRKKLYWISLLLQRMPKNISYIDSSLTFTDMKKLLLEMVFTVNKKDSYKVLHEVFEGIKGVCKIDSKETKYIFPVPVKFNAQNSGNRSGYGNRYYGEDLVYEGTLYGETTDYMFIGAKYRRW